MVNITEKELIDKLIELNKEKEKEIANFNYENAARIRDQIRRFTIDLEDLMNKKNKNVSKRNLSRYTLIVEKKLHHRI